MNTFFDNDVRTSLFEGLIAAVLLLVLNAIAHYVFDAPEIPFVYGAAVAIAAIVAGIRSFAHWYHGFHPGP